MTDTYTDYERFQIAKKEYDNELSVGKPVEIGDNDNTKPIGTVREVIKDDTGLKVYVVESSDKKEVTVLYQGSKGIGEAGSKADWLDNDVPMAKNIIFRTKKATPQLHSAAATLNRVLEKYPDAQITVYGHSLGSMNAQYALANVKDISRITGAYIYQGPNIYGILTDEQKANVDAMKYRIHNYIDQRDNIPIGFKRDGKGVRVELNSEGAVGIVHHVDSTLNLNPIYQHMWGGYVFNKDGSLKIKEDTSEIESRYSTAQDTVKAGKYRYTTIKKKLSAGGYSTNKRIFLDSEQAQMISSGLHKAAQIGYETIKEIQNQAHNKAEKLLASTRKVPFGFILSPNEVEEAYQQGGVTKTSIVDDVDTYFQPRTAKAKSLSDDFQTLEMNIKNGIQKKLNHDKQLAGDFNQWTHMK